ncbi:hypothetical protein RFI_12184, partial [Reticulomyxa filosa]
ERNYEIAEKILGKKESAYVPSECRVCKYNDPIGEWELAFCEWCTESMHLTCWEPIEPAYLPEVGLSCNFIFFIFFIFFFFASGSYFCQNCMLDALKKNNLDCERHQMTGSKAEPMDVCETGTATAIARKPKAKKQKKSNVIKDSANGKKRSRAKMEMETLLQNNANDANNENHARNTNHANNANNADKAKTKSSSKLKTKDRSQTCEKNVSQQPVGTSNKKFKKHTLNNPSGTVQGQSSYPLQPPQQAPIDNRDIEKFNFDPTLFVSSMLQQSNQDVHLSNGLTFIPTNIHMAGHMSFPGNTGTSNIIYGQNGNSFVSSSQALFTSAPFDEKMPMHSAIPLQLSSCPMDSFIKNESSNGNTQSTNDRNDPMPPIP